MTAPATTASAGFARLRDQVTLWRVLAVVLLGLGLFASIQRFVLGLGRTTNLSDVFPWGLWIGLDFLGIGLAAAGFTIVAGVHLLNIHRFEPIVRPAVLTAFIGYQLVVLVLVVDLGRPDRFWHPLVMWNPHSVMFEITWCVILYSTVLVFELTPVVLERFKITAPIRLLRSISLPFMLAGVILSTLHQSSFGSLYLIVPKRLHPLWYSPILPILFYISCIAAGLSMVIFLILQVTRSGRTHVPMSLLPQVGKVVAVITAIYGVVRVQDLMDRDAVSLAFRGGYQGALFLAEFLLGVIVPVVLLMIPAVRNSRGGLYASSVLVILGFAANRMNTVVTGLEIWPNQTYFPSWQETAIGGGIATLGFVSFYWLAKFLPVFESADPDAPLTPEPDTPHTMLTHRRREMALVALVPTTLLIFGLIFTNFFGEQKQRTPAIPPPTGAPEIATGLAALTTPDDVVLPQGEGSPGPVTFRHMSHVDTGAPDCASCHGPGKFRILKLQGTAAASPAGTMHDATHCGACHAKEIESDCTRCHGN